MIDLTLVEMWIYTCQGPLDLPVSTWLSRSSSCTVDTHAHTQIQPTCCYSRFPRLPADTSVKTDLPLVTAATTSLWKNFKMVSLLTFSTYLQGVNSFNNRKHRLAVLSLRLSTVGLSRYSYHGNRSCLSLLTRQSSTVCKHLYKVNRTTDA